MEVQIEAIKQEREEMAEEVIEAEKQVQSTRTIRLMFILMVLQRASCSQKNVHNVNHIGGNISVEILTDGNNL